jgi:phosphoglycerate-specific signal transduction histidine kinase
MMGAWSRLAGEIFLDWIAPRAGRRARRGARFGPGLDPASLEHLFNAFYTTKSGGMGMGLAICRSIIEAHEGQLWASANEPRGAVFQFTLPLQQDGEETKNDGQPHASH